MELFCSGNETLLEHQNVGRCKVLFVDYVNGEITVELGDAFSFCPVNNLTSINLTTEIFQPYGMRKMDLVSCQKDKITQYFSFNPEGGPISCLSNATQLTYMVNGIYTVSSLPYYCVVLSNNLSVPYTDTWIYDDYSDLGKGLVEHFNVTLVYYVPGVTDECKICEAEGKQCAATKSFCTHNSKSKSLSAETG